jgi:hypothetical protein
MSIRNRIERLEKQASDPSDVVFVMTTCDDSGEDIPLTHFSGGTPGSRVIEQLPGESEDDFINRAAAELGGSWLSQWVAPS